MTDGQPPVMLLRLVTADRALRSIAELVSAICAIAVTDPHWYHDTAVSLASGDGLAFRGALTAYRPPGYPWLLALTYTVFGPHPALAWVWGILATSVLLVATHHIALRLHGTTVARISLVVLHVVVLTCATALPLAWWGARNHALFGVLSITHNSSACGGHPFLKMAMLVSMIC